ncbi:MAG: S9 family peptidase [Agarilytica sp.]
MAAYQFCCLFFIVFSLFVPVDFAYSNSGKFPVEYFSELPDVNRVRISPNGENLASVVRVDFKEQKKETKGSAVQVANLKTGEKEFVFFTSNDHERIRWMRWGNDSKLLVSIIFPATRGYMNVQTNESRLLIVDVDVDKNKVRNAISTRFLNTLNYFPQFQDEVIDFLPNDDNHFLLQISTGTSVDNRVYKVSLGKPKMKLVQGSEPNVLDWTADKQGNVRIGEYFKDTNNKILHRFPGEKKWKVLWEFQSFSEDEIRPIGFGDDPNVLYVEARHGGKMAIFEVDLTDPTLKRTLVYANESYDVSGDLIYSTREKKVVGIELSDESDYVFWDEKYASFIRAINKALPGMDNYLVSTSKDENRYILYSSNSSDPGAYYFGDKKKKRLDPIAERYERLPLEHMVAKREVSYEARDGLEIEGFLTLPKGKKKGDRLPTIIFPHGGPISYSGRGFDYWTQFFANRGYAVLQMNFRGSYGYGFDFMKMGLAQWGLAMQDDVEDGTRWMIENGYADPEKVCIVGASYGGYAALMGAIKAPDLYKCVISFAGVTDLNSLLTRTRDFINYEMTKEQLGNNYGDLKGRSPAFNAAKIKAPVLLVHGESDRRVSVSQSRTMRNELKKHKKDVTYVELEKGSHYLGNNDNRVATFKVMDTFLSQHLN